METLQDKLAQIRDAREALDALREDHREKLRREAEEAERIRQIQLAQKLEIMRQKKQVRCFITSKRLTQNGVCNLGTSVYYTDIQGRSQNLRHFYSSMGLKVGSLGFSRKQNNRGLLGAYVTCIFCGLSVNIYTWKNATWQAKIVDAFVLHFAYVFGKNPKTPILAP